MLPSVDPRKPEMTLSSDSQERGAGGAIVRLIGVVFIILGGLNTMLSWRGGFDVLSLPVFLIGTGLIFYAIGGNWRGKNI